MIGLQIRHLGWVAILAVTAAVVFLFSQWIVFASTFVDDTQVEFDLGTYSNTEWSSDHVELSASQSSGTYTSQIFEGIDSGIVDWNTIGWNTQRPVYKELPDEGVVESAYGVGNMNMKGNIFLMHMNEAVGSTFFVEKSGNNYNGSCGGGSCPTAEVSGHFNTALQFDGTDDAVDLSSETIGDALNTAATVTIGAWVYPETVVSPVAYENAVVDALIDGTNSGLWMNVEASDSYKLRIGGRSQTSDSFQEVMSTSSVAQNQWSFVAGVVNIASDTITTYINGVDVGSGAVSFGNGSYSADGTPSRGDFIGGGSTSPFLGRIDEVVIWAKELSPTDIMDLYLRGGLRLQYQVRACDDAACSGESYIGPDGTSSTYYSEWQNTTLGLPTLNITNLSTDRYFQYQATVESDNLAYTPQLFDLTIDYDASDPLPPGDVADLAVSSVTSFSITVGWTAPGDDGYTVESAASYDLRYDTSLVDDISWSGNIQVVGEPTPASAGSSESLTISGLTPETTYYIALKASDEIPNESGLSNVISVTTPEYTPPDTTPPSITNISVINISETAADITWQTNENATSQVEYGLSQSYGSLTTEDPGLVTTHSVALSGLNSGTLYHLRVISRDSADNQSASSDVTFTTDSVITPKSSPTPTSVPSSSGSPTPTPAPPSLEISDVTSSNTSSAQTTVGWATDRDATSQVRYGTESGVYSFETVTTASLRQVHSVVITDLASETTYFYVVVSVSSDNSSVTSGERSFTTSAPSAVTVEDNIVLSPVIVPGETVVAVPILPTENDTTPPTVIINDFPIKPVTESNVVISGEAVDQEGVVVSISISLDEGNSWHPIRSVTGIGTDRVTFQYVSELEDGDYEVIVRVRDNSGNEMISDVQILTVDLLAPIFGGSKLISGNQAVSSSDVGVVETISGYRQSMVVSAKGGPNNVVLRAHALTEGVQDQVFIMEYLDNVGLWVGDVEFDSPGVFRLELFGSDRAENEVYQDLTVVSVIDSGKVVDALTEDSIESAQILLVEHVPILNEWMAWDGVAYQQSNPEITDEAGRYQFFVPPGQYYLQIVADGYKQTVSPILTYQSPTQISGDLHLNAGELYFWSTPLLATQSPLIINEPAEVEIENPVTQQQIDKSLKVIEGVDLADIQIRIVGPLGKPTVITLWNTWDTQSQEQIAELDQMYLSQESSRFAIVPLALQEDPSVVKNYLRRGQYQIASLTDELGMFTQSHLVMSVPQHFLVNGDGVIKKIITGFVDQSTLITQLDQL